MAYVDYTHCGVCDRKVFYDASVDYDYQTGDWTALCIACSETHELVVRNKETGELTMPKNIFIESIRAEREKHDD